MHDAFVRELTTSAARLRAGSARDAAYGRIIMPGQVDVIRRHIADALADGGRALTGGGVDGTLVEPTVLVDVPESSTAVREEAFGRRSRSPG